LISYGYVNLRIAERTTYLDQNELDHAERVDRRKKEK